MSALSPAPAPTSGVRWTDLPTPIDIVLASCCLSYKQRRFCRPFVFITLQIPFPASPMFSHPYKTPGSVTHSVDSHSGLLRLCVSQPLPAPTTSGWQTLCFHQLAVPWRELGGGAMSRPTVARLSVRGLGVDPLPDMRLEEAQGHGALLQDGVVEGADVELGAKVPLGVGAQFANS